jgi:hypothetical protein
LSVSAGRGGKQTAGYMQEACEQIGVDPVRCYEQLRFHVLDNPFYKSHGMYMLQRQGMFRWLKSDMIFNTLQAFEVSSATDQQITMPVHGSGETEGIKSKLSILLADIIIAIYNGGV